jgi:hypothetical protein
MSRHSSRSAVGQDNLSAANSSSKNARHNVSRIPELDYFVRKLAAPDEPRWTALDYAKAAEAKDLPNSFRDMEHYLRQMQAHTALEFQVGLQDFVEIIYCAANFQS